MTVTAGYRNLVQDLLEPLGSIAVRRMFGGAGVFCEDVMFALIDEDTLYFKADDKNRQRFLDAGCGPFVYTGKNGKNAQMSYYSLPDDLLDDSEALCEWGREALDAALRARAITMKAKPTPNRQEN